jgi:hypothetical protein
MPSSLGHNGSEFLFLSLHVKWVGNSPGVAAVGIKMKDMTNTVHSKIPPSIEKNIECTKYFNMPHLSSFSNQNSEVADVFSISFLFSVLFIFKTQICTRHCLLL